MQYEYSYGIIPLQKNAEGQWCVLIVQHQEGHWAFPKGHAEENESPQETAVRELKEETSLNVIAFLSPLPLEEHYKIVRKGESILKTVVYYLAEVEGKISLQTKEIRQSAWVLLDDASSHVTFSEAKMLCNLIKGQLSGPSHNSFLPPTA